MALSAFHADDKLRHEAVDKLRACLADGKLKPGPLHWDADGGSVVGCILQDEDLSHWELRLGLPQWLAVTLDALCAQQPSETAAFDFAVAAIDAIAPGSDLGPAGSAVILAVFDRIGAESPSRLPAGLTDALDSVRALHRRAADDEQVSPAEWRGARKSATALSDSLSETPKWEQSCATCIETAAWDAQRSPSVVFDTLRVWRGALMERAIAGFGWDQEADTAMGELLQSLYDEYVKDSPDPELTVFDMLAKHHPEQDKRLLAKYEVERGAADTSLGEVTGMLLAVLSRN